MHTRTGFCCDFFILAACINMQKSFIAVVYISYQVKIATKVVTESKSRNGVNYIQLFVTW